MPLLLALCLLAVTACSAPTPPGLAHEGQTPIAEQPACRPEPPAGATTVGRGVAADAAAPEPASGYRIGLEPVTTRSFMVVAAHPLASQAGCNVLAAGGSAVDAAVAVQAVLGLVEPQSSGLGGGAVMLHYDAASRRVEAYDGRETAPAAATEDDLRWIDGADRRAPLPSARASGRSIGTPGVPRLLELAHRDHGRLPWRALFGPAIRLAEDGFPVGGRLADALAAAGPALRRDAEARATYFDADGRPRAQGAVLRVPAYAATLRAVADDGADAFYRGRIARAIVDKVRSARDGDGDHGDPGDTGVGPVTPGKTTLADLAGYRARRREPVCTAYRSHWVCGMPPPSSGGIAVAQTLGILERFDLASDAPRAVDREGGVPQAAAVHRIAEAERLAYADRDAYLADTDIVPLPPGGAAAMLDRGYLRRRAALIDEGRSLGTAAPGRFDAAPPPHADRTPEHGTSHLTVVDRDGDVVVMTTTVESSFGSFHMAAGVVLNNQLTDFSAIPVDADGRPVANRLQPGKRPRSTMAPTLVFERAADGSRGDFWLGTGSPGGGAIVQYVVKTLVGLLDWRLDAQQAAGLVDFGAENAPTTFLGGEHPAIAAGDGALAAGLRARGHRVSTRAQSSGVATVMRAPPASGGAWQGGVDPRREGVALGDRVSR